MPDYGYELLTLVKRIKDLEKTLQVFPVLLTYSGNPDGVLTAREGTFAWDDTNHRLYLNVSSGEGDDWLPVNIEGTKTGWSKITADSVTLTSATSANVVADLQTANDGNVFTVAEAAGSAGQNLIVDFVDVTAFNWVHVLETYEGSATHALEIELYNWSSAAWDHYGCSQTAFSNTGTIFCNKSFIIPTDTPYIGTGGNLGDVRVRFVHPMSGNISHRWYFDVVALYL